MIELRSDQKVTLLLAWGDDKDVVEDARTSVRKPGASRPPRDENRSLSERELGLLEDLIAHGHVSTLRGCGLKVEVETTINMQRQLRTHWVGNRQIWPDVNFDFEESDFLGFNDQSGKYARYKPTFWIANREQIRVEVDGFKPMDPAYRPATDDEYEIYRDLASKGYEHDWEIYSQLNDLGFSREITRAHIPGGIYVAGRITANLNAWLGLISKRVDHPDNVMVTKPQPEIQEIATQVEALIAERWPAVYRIWTEKGRSRL